MRIKIVGVGLSGGKYLEFEDAVLKNPPAEYTALHILDIPTGSTLAYICGGRWDYVVTREAEKVVEQTITELAEMEKEHDNALLYGAPEIAS